MADVNSTAFIIILNVNGVNNPMKGHIFSHTLNKNLRYNYMLSKRDIPSDQKHK